MSNIDNPRNERNNKKLCAIVLAAGLSSRMGAFKPLLEIAGKPAIEYLVDNIEGAGIDDIIVVTGHNREKLTAKLAENPKLIEVNNINYNDGMFTSIQTGIERATENDDYDAALLFLVDVPLVTSKTIRQVSEHEAEGFIVPCYQGKKGHPLLIPAKHFPEILEHNGGNGLKDITNKHNSKMIRMNTKDESVVIDMDTPEGYRELLNYHDIYCNVDGKVKNSGKTQLQLFLAQAYSGRLILIRHGSTKLHKDKIFLGQTDVPLSEKGKAEATEAGKKVLKLKPKTNKIYTSDLKRTLKTAEIIADIMANEKSHLSGNVFTEINIIEKTNFREMHLGDWDGEYISDVREKNPEEYKKRGEDRLLYKRDPDGENYYDLKYRVLKELENIIEDQMNKKVKDIIIVTHKGVINAIKDEVYKTDPNETIKEELPRGSVTVVEA